jgi:hypothetical protein
MQGCRSKLDRCLTPLLALGEIAAEEVLRVI